MADAGTEKPFLLFDISLPELVAVLFQEREDGRIGHFQQIRLLRLGLLQLLHHGCAFLLQLIESGQQRALVFDLLQKVDDFINLLINLCDRFLEALGCIAAGIFAALDLATKGFAQLLDGLGRHYPLEQNFDHGLLNRFLFDASASATGMAAVIAAGPHHVGAATASQDAGQQVGGDAFALSGCPLGFPSGDQRLGFFFRDHRLMGIALDNPFLAIPVAGASDISAIDAFIVTVPHRMPGIGQGRFLNIDHCGFSTLDA